MAKKILSSCRVLQQESVHRHSGKGLKNGLRHDKRPSELIWSQESPSPCPIKQSWDESVQAKTTEARNYNSVDAQ